MSNDTTNEGYNVSEGYEQNLFYNLTDQEPSSVVKDQKDKEKKIKEDMEDSEQSEKFEEPSQEPFEDEKEGFRSKKQCWTWLFVFLIFIIISIAAYYIIDRKLLKLPSFNLFGKTKHSSSHYMSSSSPSVGETFMSIR